MITKRLIRPERLRQVPPRFNWVDHRLVSQDFIGRCEHGSLALYLFLVIVADAQGLSFYSDPAIARRLKMSQAQLLEARHQLVKAELIAYQKPLYQVLALEAASLPPLSGIGQESRSGQVQSAGDVLRRVLQSVGGVS